MQHIDMQTWLSRTQKANTVTDAEGNCWVANRSVEWSGNTGWHGGRKTGQKNPRARRKYFCFTPTETNERTALSLSPLLHHRFQTVVQGEPGSICVDIGCNLKNNGYPMDRAMFSKKLGHRKYIVK